MDMILAHMTSFFELAPSALNAASLVIAAASAVTALTPTPKDDAFLAKIYRGLEILALNIGHAKMRPPKG